MNQAQLFLSHSPVIGVVFKLSDNDNHLSILFPLYQILKPHFRSQRWLRPFFHIYNLGIRGKTPISLPTWILSVDGIFQIEYSRRGLARQSWAGDQNEQRHHPSLFHGLPTLRNLFLAHLVRKSKTCNVMAVISIEVTSVINKKGLARAGSWFIKSTFPPLIL